jgi:hypothetical protein
MQLRQALTAAVLLLGISQAAAAQSVVAVATATAPNASVAPVDVSRLPIDIRRIEQRFRQTSVREERDGLNLRYFIDVYAKAPDIVLFTKEDNLKYGPVPYGGPTHREMLDMITPQEHRAPAADFGALMRWLSNKKDK